MVGRGGVTLREQSTRSLAPLQRSQRGEKTIERSQHPITRLVREAEMGESLRDFGGQMPVGVMGWSGTGAANPETLRQSGQS